MSIEKGWEAIRRMQAVSDEQVASMNTDTNAVTRWDWDYEETFAKWDGDYVLFTDHERVVGELKDHIRLSAISALELDAQNRKELAASRAEVEGLKKDAERYRWLKVGGAPAVSYLEMCPSSDSWDKAIDAAMENGNV